MRAKFEVVSHNLTEEGVVVHMQPATQVHCYQYAQGISFAVTQKVAAFLPPGKQFHADFIPAD